MSTEGQGGLIGGRNHFGQAYRTFMYTWNFWGDTSLPLSTGAQYFALINLNLRFQFCAKTSFSLLLILLVFQESTLLRDEQCQRYNDVPYQGTYHTWRGAQQADSPCSLDCQAETDPDVIQRFATHAEDGTRCSGYGSLKLCLEGVCEVRRPGLSHVVRSQKQFYF